MTQVGPVSNGGNTRPYQTLPHGKAGPVRFSANAAAIAPVMRQQVWHRLSPGGRLLNRATDLLVPVFQKITEVYVVSFLALDVVGLWVPRIWTSAKTGRIPYDPQQDPEAKDKPFKEQVKLWILGNVKGLNWANLEEETSREAATGPGLLVIPSLMYVIASRMLGGTGIHLRHQALNDLCNGFEEHIKSSPLARAGADLNLSEYRRAMGDYIASIFKDGDMRKTRMPQGGTYGEYIDRWAQRWADAMEVDGSKAARKTQAKALARLSEELHENLLAFNGEHRLQPYQIDSKTIGAKASDPLIHRMDHVWGSFSKTGKLQHLPMGQLLTDLTKWTDVARGIYTLPQKNLKTAGAKLPEVIEFVRRRVMAHKTLFSLGATLLGTMYLFQLVFWTQRHKSYQATRLLHEGIAPGQPNAKPGPDAGRNSQLAQSAFLSNNISQPVFPAYGQGPVFNSGVTGMMPPPGAPGGWA